MHIHPANCLEALKGKHAGQHTQDQWRICFVWREGQCSQVEIVDYR